MLGRVGRGGLVASSRTHYFKIATTPKSATPIEGNRARSRGVENKVSNFVKIERARKCIKGPWNHRSSHQRSLRLHPLDPRNSYNVYAPSPPLLSGRARRRLLAIATLLDEGVMILDVVALLVSHFQR